MTGLGQNKLSFNPGKTTFIFFQPKHRKINLNQFELSFGGEKIQQTKCTKFLGLYIDECLTWEYHVKNVMNKISCNAYLLNRIKKIIPKKFMRQMYFSYIHSIIDYGLTLWGPMIDKLLLNKLITQQKKIVRILDGAKFNTSTPPLFKKFRILKLTDQIEIGLAKFGYQFSNKELPNPILKLCLSNDDTHQYNTRNKMLPRNEKHKSKVFHSSFLNKVPSIIQQYPSLVAKSNTCRSFLKSLTRSKLDQY